MDEPKPFGRPTKYSQELLEKAAHYAEDGWKEVDHPFPSIVGLCKVIQITSSTAHKWAHEDDDKQEFSDTLKIIQDNQHLETLHGAMKGDFSAPISKLVLHNHGYSDKSQQEISGPDGGPVEVDHEFRITVVEPNA